ncbi:helix-turn-helix domain-containing protein [Jiella sonneratiae]|uniref:Chromosomal replication initiator DnaA C-terminal domain-containing protein n=1 Tax=Jiella sonneratiae TaxID=2816856 RepID=A0ABS3JA14_9HYPH|nr:helix-turn-helix domain-containing protein [Jiella sonneratiae]MBO0905962.1 hypothetical protein [Jiella sonneratiae]
MQFASASDGPAATERCRDEPRLWWEEAARLQEPPGPSSTVQLRMATVAAACRLAQEIAAFGFDVPVAEIRRASRAESRACDARHVAMYLANTTFGISSTRIGAAFGRERTSISYAIRRVEDLRDDEAFDRRLQRLEDLAVAACRAIETGVAVKLAAGDRR